MISLGIKIEPSHILTICSCDLLPSVLLIYSARSFSEIIIMISYTAPSVFPGNSLTIGSKIISVVIVSYQRISVDHTVFICCIISSIGSLFHGAFQDVAIGIQQIGGISFDISVQFCGSYTTLIILTDILNISTHAVIEPAFSFAVNHLSPAFMEHPSRNCAVFFKIILIGNSVYSQCDISCPRFSVFIQTVIFTIDLKVTRVCSGFLLFLFQLCNSLLHTIGIKITEYAAIPLPGRFLLLSYCGSIGSYRFIFTAWIYNCFLCCCKIILYSILRGFCCTSYSFCAVLCSFPFCGNSCCFRIYLSLSGHHITIFIKKVTSCM